jgi:hypothetical protein
VAGSKSKGVAQQLFEAQQRRAAHKAALEKAAQAAAEKEKRAAARREAAAARQAQRAAEDLAKRQQAAAYTGLVVTTSAFGPASYAFAAEVGRITLIDGPRLRALIKEHLGRDTVISARRTATS